MDKFTFAEKVATDFAASSHHFVELAGDGTFLEFLKQLFETLIPLLTGCLVPAKEAAQSALKNTVIGRWRRARLNRHVRDEIDDFGMEGEILHPLVGSILKVVAAS